MIQYEVKLKLNIKQEQIFNEWLYHLTGVWNWAIRKIELDAKDKIYYSTFEFQNLLAGHSVKMNIPAHTMQEVLETAFIAWKRCFSKQSRKPKLKGKRNRMRSIPFPDPIKIRKNNRVFFGKRVGFVPFHKQWLPEGKINCGRVIKRASGWYLCLCIKTDPKQIPISGYGQIGVDPGFISLLTVSTGEKIPHPREYERLQQRLGQSQRGNNHKLSRLLQEKISNQRKDRNHKLSRRLVSENALIVFSKDNVKGIAQKFGKSVSSSAHSKLRQMLAYKCRTDGRRYVEVDSKFSTKTCSDCGCLSGPSGWSGLKVRQWECKECGSSHDRDVNAAINTLKAGLGTSHEVLRANALGSPKSPITKRDVHTLLLTPNTTRKLQ